VHKVRILSVHTFWIDFLTTVIRGPESIFQKQTNRIVSSKNASPLQNEERMLLKKQ